MKSAVRRHYRDCQRCQRNRYRDRGLGRRRDRERLQVGDFLDCSRVEAFEAGRKLRLAAEMKMAGRAWLVFEVAGDAGGSIFRQTAIFDPVGLGGLTYRYLVYPLHQYVFAGMLRGIARAADHHAGVP